MQRKGFQIRIWQWGLLCCDLRLLVGDDKARVYSGVFHLRRQSSRLLFGEPVIILQRIWEWFAGGEIYSHLGVTLYETVMAFVIGTVAGLAVGLWLALSPVAAAVADPFIKGFNSMPRVILCADFRRVVRTRAGLQDCARLHARLLHCLFSMSIRACAK